MMAFDNTTDSISKPVGTFKMADFYSAKTIDCPGGTTQVNRQKSIGNNYLGSFCCCL